MARRLLVPSLALGRNVLPGDQAHHARNVLRLGPGDAVELFTAGGLTGQAILSGVDEDQVTAEVLSICETAAPFDLTIASAVPKAARADWMIEKLSELGVGRFIPLQTARSVVHPEGRNKIERWQRLAAESAKQSHRAGVMEIAPLTPLVEVLADLRGTAGYLSTGPGGRALSSIVRPACSLVLLIGPEGGWTDGERGAFADHHLTAITLGTTILRVETAAMCAAAVVAALAPFGASGDPENRP